MKIEQLYTSCLAEAAYYIESNGEVAIIDPLRETQPYIDKALENGAKIKYIFETHFHADFVSGHVDLAKESGATIVYGPTAKTSYDVKVAEDGEVFHLGDVSITVLHTPGHTLESSSYLLKDENEKDVCVFTGDTLFIGDVGRPDLAVKTDLTEKELAGMLYDSLRTKIMTLDDNVTIYPAHGAGSACGKNISKETYSTLGVQKKSNYALRADMTKDEFVKEVTDGILPAPQYFAKNAMINKEGYDNINEILENGSDGLTVDKFKKEIKKGALVLDTRNQQVFCKAFIPGSLFIGIDGGFAPWVGALITNIEHPIVFIADEGREEEVVLRLARVGYDHTVGFLKGGIDAWVADGNETDKITSISAEDLSRKMKSEKIHLLDARKPSEYGAEHIKDVANFPLDFINEHLNDLDKNETLHIHCAGGYRSMIAISILKANGYNNLIDIAGGFGAIKKTNIPLTEYVCPTTI